MANYNVLFCEENDTLLKEAVGFFVDDNEVTLVPCGGIKDGVLPFMENVQGLVIDKEFPCIREIIQYYRVKGARVIITARLDLLSSDDEFSVPYPHDYVFFKPYSLLDVRGKIVKTMQQKALEIKLRNGKSVDERLSNIFIRFGIPPHIKGYQYLREAIKLSIVHPEMVSSVTKTLYPTVSQTYDTTPTRVERAIRHAIDVGWERRMPDALNSLFGVKLFSKTERPTNSELIALVADKIMIESL